MKQKEMTPKDYEQLGRMLETVYISGNKNIKRVLWFNFVRGMAYGFGLFIAGTLVVGVVLWILGLFDQAPIVGPFVQSVLNYLSP